MRFFLCQKTTNKCDVLQKGTIWGGGGVPQKVSTLFAHLRYVSLICELRAHYLF